MYSIMPAFLGTVPGFAFLPRLTISCSSRVRNSRISWIALDCAFAFTSRRVLVQFINKGILSTITMVRTKSSYMASPRYASTSGSILLCPVCQSCQFLPHQVFSRKYSPRHPLFRINASLNASSMPIYSILSSSPSFNILVFLYIPYMLLLYASLIHPLYSLMYPYIHIHSLTLIYFLYTHSLLLIFLYSFYIFRFKNCKYILSPSLPSSLSFLSPLSPYSCGVINNILFP